MSKFTIKIEGIDRIKNKLGGDKLYGNAIRHQLDTLAQIALALARRRAPQKTGRLMRSLDYEVSKASVPTWSKVTMDPGSPFRYGYALDSGGTAGGREYHYRSLGVEGKSLQGWLSKIRPSMKAAIGSAAAVISREIEGIWRQ